LVNAIAPSSPIRRNRCIDDEVIDITTNTEAEKPTSSVTSALSAHHRLRYQRSSTAVSIGV